MKERRIRFNPDLPDDPIFWDTNILCLAAMLDPSRRHRGDCIIHRLLVVDPGSRSCVAPNERLIGAATEGSAYLMKLGYAFWANAAGLFASFPGGLRDAQKHLTDLAARSPDTLVQICDRYRRDSVTGSNSVEKGLPTVVLMRQQIAQWIAEDAWNWGCCSCYAATHPPFVPLQAQPVTFVHKASIKPYDIQTLITAAVSLDSDDLAEICHDQRREDVNFARDKGLAADPLPVRPFSRTEVLDGKCSVQQPSPPRAGYISFVELYKRITKPSSTAKLEDLTGVRLGSLKYPSSHQGKMLIVRILTEPVVFGTGLKYMVEDEYGDSIALFMEYPLPKPALEYSAGFLKEIHPVGTVYKVKEPFVHFGSLSGQPEILVSVPTDVKEVWGDGGVTWAHPSPGQEMTASALKDAGNTALTDKETKNPLLAVILYSRALGDPNLSAMDRFILLINRMQAAISAGRPGSAVRDSIEALSLIQKGAKPTDAQRRKFKERRQTALRLTSDSANARLGPIEFRASGDRGFGIFATAPIKAGTVVIDEEPLVQIEADPSLPYNYVAYFDDDENPRSMYHWAAVGTAIHGAIDDPRKMAMWDRLHPRTSDELRQYALEKPLEEQASVDAMTISSKLNKNANAVESTGSNPALLDVAGRDIHGVMLNPHYSGLNHSCLPNVCSVELQGTQKRGIAAARDIETGEELCNCYAAQMYGQGLIVRQAMMRNWNFMCSCDLCWMDRQDNFEIRHRLMSVEWAFVPKQKLQDIPALEQFLAKVEATYARERTLKPESAKVLFCMCMAASDPADKFRYGKAALIATGTVLCSESERRAMGRAVKSFQLEILGHIEMFTLVLTIAQAMNALARRITSDVTLAEAEAWNAAADGLRGILCPGFRA